VDHAVLLERRLQLSHLLDRGAAPDALVTEHGVAVLVFDRDDLVVERAGILCGGGLFMRAQRELVERGAVEAPLLGDHLRADALVGVHAVAVHEALRERVAATGERRAHRHPRHRLDATGHHRVVMAGHHTGRGEVDGLLAGPALPVNRHAGNAFRPSRRQQRRARDVHGLLAGLHDAAPDHVVDDLRVDPGALHQRVEHLRGQVRGMHTRQPAVALADR